jgi:hypothetical protein
MLNFLANSCNYQLAFLTPGILPSLANSRKQIRHRPKSLIKPCLRPHRKQRLTTRDLNFGVFAARAMTDVFAIIGLKNALKIPGQYLS